MPTQEHPLSRSRNNWPLAVMLVVVLCALGGSVTLAHRAVMHASAQTRSVLFSALLP